MYGQVRIPEAKLERIRRAANALKTSNRWLWDVDLENGVADGDKLASLLTSGGSHRPGDHSLDALFEKYAGILEQEAREEPIVENLLEEALHEQSDGTCGSGEGENRQ